MIDIDQFLLRKAPDSVYYVPNFITAEEESNILREVYNAPKPKWTCLSHRRLQNWGGVPHAKGMIAEPLPKWLQFFMDRTVSIGAFPDQFAPNHVLVNEYLPGQGILPHFDGPLFYPTISNITCGSHTMLQIHQANEVQPIHRLLLERRSLLVLKDDMYHKYQHSIAECHSDVINDEVINLENLHKGYKAGEAIERQTRVSLTIRHVPFTTKFKLKFSR